ncbi:unnamed protein product [Linum trigynum]
MSFLPVLVSITLLLARATAEDPAFPDPCQSYTYNPSDTLPYGRANFPPGFVFGTATSAYQVEGAANQSCRGPSVWDKFAHQFPERIADRSNGDVAIDMYNLFVEDIQRMKYMNVDAYRLSISWSRVIPYGKRSTGVNREGIDFYHRVIDLLKQNGIEPYVTIWHWDTPQALEAEYGGFLSRDIVKDFEDYCDLLFEEYGGKITKWITLNEPVTYVMRGYDEGLMAPGRCSTWVNHACLAGNSGTEPYIVTHNLLLAHAAGYRLYQQKYKASQGGEVGITIVTFWFVPYTDTTADIDAAQRSLDFMYGWYMDPITYGHYPRNMIDLVGSRLPTFTSEESRSLKGSYDFLGLNYYTAYYSMNNPNFDPEHLEYLKDSHAITTATGANGELIGPELGTSWQYLYPQGLQYLLNYTKDTYRNPHIYITENGLSQEDDPTQSIEEATQDDTRISFYDSHLDSVLQSMIGYNVNVSGFFAWSFADNYEWNDGYSVRFGFYYIDYTDGQLTRYPKSSACWYTNFLNRNAPTGQTLIRQKTIHSDKLQAQPTARRPSAAGGRRALPRRPRQFSRW